MNLMKGGLVLLLLAFVLSTPMHSANPRTTQEHLELLLHQTMHALYDFNFSKADSLSSSMQQTYPDHYLSHFTRVNYLWWMIITNPPDEALEQEYSRTIQMAKDALKPFVHEQMPAGDLFYHINIYAMQARLSLEKKDYLTTVRNLRSCVHQIEYSLGQEHLHPQLNLSSGLYNYMTDFSQKKYPMIKVFRIFYPQADMQLGLRQLRMAERSENIVWKTEASYLLMKIFLEMEMQPDKAIPYIRWLTSTYPQNLTYQRYYYMIYKAMKDTEGMARTKGNITRLAMTHGDISKSQRDYFIDFANP